MDSTCLRSRCSGDVGIAHPETIWNTNTAPSLRSRGIEYSQSGVAPLALQCKLGRRPLSAWQQLHTQQSLRKLQRTPKLACPFETRMTVQEIQVFVPRSQPNPQEIQGSMGKTSFDLDSDTNQYTTTTFTPGHLAHNTH